MINRDNYLDAKSYLAYLSDVRQNDPKTVKRVWAWMRHLLNWADDCPFPKIENRSPSFPVYLLTARISGTGPLAPITMKKDCEYVRDFFAFSKRTHPGRYKTPSAEWVDMIRPPRSHGTQSTIRVHAFYKLEDVIKIAQTPVDTLRLERDRAAACFLFLSGMRADAFVSMPIENVDLVTCRVTQLPTQGGMRTKNHKAAVTSLMAIPELLSVVNAWDTKVRNALPASAHWYAEILHNKEEFSRSTVNSDGRRFIFTEGLAKLCKAASVPYLSPHKFRHGHAVYALMHVSNMTGLKAVSQNLMHSSVGITDGIYGQMIEDDVHDLITSLGSAPAVKPAEAKEEDPILAMLRKKIMNDPEFMEKLFKE